MARTPGGLEYTFAKHARDRMVQRGISRKDVEDVIDDWDTCHPDPKKNTAFDRGMAGGRRLRVVLDTARNPARVVTVIILD